MSHSRRELLTLAAAVFLPLHQRSRVRAQQPATPPASRRPRLQRIQLQTHVLGDIRRFYRETLQFPEISTGRQEVAFQAGATRLEFRQVSDGSRPFYHFAFNIPENKIEAARRWLRPRVDIQRHAQLGNEVIHFAEWNAHSLFFDDPAGNLVEFIARHTLANAADGEFGVGDVLYASEIGIVPSDQRGVFAAVRDGLNLPVYLNSGSFLGDEHGIIIVIPNQVKWIPRFVKSGIVCPTQVTIAGHGTRRVHFPEGPFAIESVEG